jgi:hypothetical protein
MDSSVSKDHFTRQVLLFHLYWTKLLLVENNLCLPDLPICRQMNHNTVLLLRINQQRNLFDAGREPQGSSAIVKFTESAVVIVNCVFEFNGGRNQNDTD